MCKITIVISHLCGSVGRLSFFDLVDFESNGMQIIITNNHTRVNLSRDFVGKQSGRL